MPLLTRLFLLSSMLYLLLYGVGEVLLNLLPGIFEGISPFPTLFHLFTIGWITQMIFGVAFWMFPKPRKGTEPRGREGWARLSFFTINLGLLLRVVAEPWVGRPHPSPWIQRSLGASALLLWLGGISFAIHIVPRIRR